MDSKTAAVSFSPYKLLLGDVHTPVNQTSCASFIHKPSIKTETSDCEVIDKTALGQTLVNMRNMAQNNYNDIMT